MRVGANLVLQICRTAGLFVGPTTMFVALIMGKMVAAVAKNCVINLMRTSGARFSSEIVAQLHGMPMNNS